MRVYMRLEQDFTECGVSTLILSAGKLLKSLSRLLVVFDEDMMLNPSHSLEMFTTETTANRVYRILNRDN